MRVDLSSKTYVSTLFEHRKDVVLLYYLCFQTILPVRPDIYKKWIAWRLWWTGMENCAHTALHQLLSSKKQINKKSEKIKSEKCNFFFQFHFYLELKFMLSDVVVSNAVECTETWTKPFSRNIGDLANAFIEWKAREKSNRIEKTLSRRQWWQWSPLIPCNPTFNLHFYRTHSCTFRHMQRKMTRAMTQSQLRPPLSNWLFLLYLVCVLVVCAVCTVHCTVCGRPNLPRSQALSKNAATIAVYQWNLKQMRSKMTLCEEAKNTVRMEKCWWCARVNAMLNAKQLKEFHRFWCRSGPAHVLAADRISVQLLAT